MLTTVIAVCFPKISFAQATINNNVSVTFSYPVPLTGNISQSLPFYTMQNFNDGREYKIEVTKDSPLMANNVQFSVNGITFTDGSTFTYTAPANGGVTAFGVTYYLSPGTAIGQTQLIKFKISKRTLGLWDWQSTFFYYIYSNCSYNGVLDQYGPLGAGDYEVTNSLDVKIAAKPSGGLVELDGGASVNLLPGFITDLSAGGAVQAIIDGCGGAYRISNPTHNNNENKDEVLNNNIHIYPNPSSGIFNIEFNETLAQKVTVYDAIGKVVYENMTDTNSTNVRIDISEFTTGMYFVKINAREKVIIKKIIKD